MNSVQANVGSYHLMFRTDIVSIYMLQMVLTHVNIKDYFQILKAPSCLDTCSRVHVETAVSLLYNYRQPPCLS